MVTYPITIYFDGSCKLCSSEINNLVARDKHGAILLIDCSPVDFDDRGLPANRETMMNMIHARDAAGEWLRGVDVFIAAYRAADMNFVSRLLAHRWIKPHAERGYPWVVRNRFRLSKLGLHRVMQWLTPSPKLTDEARSKTAFARSQTCVIEREGGDGFSIGQGRDGCVVASGHRPHLADSVCAGRRIPFAWREARFTKPQANSHPSPVAGGRGSSVSI